MVLTFNRIKIKKTLKKHILLYIRVLTHFIHKRLKIKMLDILLR